MPCTDGGTKIGSSLPPQVPAAPLWNATNRHPRRTDRQRHAAGISYLAQSPRQLFEFDEL